MNFQPQTARTGLKALTPEIFRQERNAVEELRQNPKHSKAWATLASKVRFLSSLFPEAQNPHINPYNIIKIRWTTLFPQAQNPHIDPYNIISLLSGGPPPGETSTPKNSRRHSPPKPASAELSARRRPHVAQPGRPLSPETPEVYYRWWFL